MCSGLGRGHFCAGAKTGAQRSDPSRVDRIRTGTGPRIALERTGSDPTPEPICVELMPAGIHAHHLHDAVDQRRRDGLDVPPELLAHISPLGWAHILLTGEYRWPEVTEPA